MPESMNSNILWMYYDKILKLLMNEKISGILMNSSKNDLLILIYLFRFSEASVSELAEHISSPLNTVTGIVTRLEKRGLISRIRQMDDRRVVKISLTQSGQEEVDKSVSMIMHYIDAIGNCLTDEETAVLFKLVDKVITAVNENTKAPSKRVRRITIE